MVYFSQCPIVSFRAKLAQREIPGAFAINSITSLQDHSLLVDLYGHQY